MLSIPFKALRLGAEAINQNPIKYNKSRISGSNKTLSFTKQTRCGDESTTVFAVCYDCHNKWMMS